MIWWMLGTAAAIAVLWIQPYRVTIDTDGDEIRFYVWKRERR